MFFILTKNVQLILIGTHMASSLDLLPLIRDENAEVYLNIILVRKIAFQQWNFGHCALHNGFYIDNTLGPERNDWISDDIFKHILLIKTLVIWSN